MLRNTCDNGILMKKSNKFNWFLKVSKTIDEIFKQNFNQLN